MLVIIHLASTVAHVRQAMTMIYSIRVHVQRVVVVEIAVFVKMGVPTSTVPMEDNASSRLAISRTVFALMVIMESTVKPVINKSSSFPGIDVLNKQISFINLFYYSYSSDSLD